MTEDPQQRLFQFLEWGNTYGKEKGFVRLFSLMYRPMLMPVHPDCMKKILKTAGN